MKTIKETLLILAIGCIIGFVVNAFSEQPVPLIPQPKQVEQWPVLTLEEVRQYIDEGLGIIIDARDAKYFEMGHLPGAVNLPAKEFGEVFATIGDSLPQDFPLVVYCHGGNCSESHEVLEYLEELEFHPLFIFSSGWEEWEANGLPIEKTE